MGGHNPVLFRVTPFSYNIIDYMYICICSFQFYNGTDLKLRVSVAMYTQSYCIDNGGCTESSTREGESIRFDTQYDLWRGESDEMFMFLPVKAHSFQDSKIQRQQQLQDDLTITYALERLFLHVNQLNMNVIHYN